MRPIQRIISIGFATAAIASASLPALSWNAWADADSHVAAVDAGPGDAIRTLHVALAETVQSTESNRR